LKTAVKATLRMVKMGTLTRGIREAAAAEAAAAEAAAAEAAAPGAAAAGGAAAGGGGALVPSFSKLNADVGGAMPAADDEAADKAVQLKLAAAKKHREELAAKEAALAQRKKEVAEARQRVKEIAEREEKAKADAAAAAARAEREHAAYLRDWETDPDPGMLVNLIRQFQLRAGLV
jgi:hypothetical protein